MNEATTGFVELSDGRRLSYCDWGTGENGTWVHCHGIPGSRHELAHLKEALSAAGMRLIVPDRPGYGDSTAHSHYGFAQHTADLVQLADSLELGRVSVCGFSGGGVFALAAAQNQERRFERLAIAATPAVPLMSKPFDYASDLTANAWQAALSTPESLALELEPLTASAEGLLQAFVDAAGPSEARYLSTEPFRQSLLESMRTALAQGSVTAAKAIARDTALMANPWPFVLGQFSGPVRVIHGQCDQLVQPEHQSALMARLPGATSCLVDDAGHYAVLASLWSLR